ncbi:hypothetical protein pb186bvf_010300 [Paramecium bursaria]
MMPQIIYRQVRQSPQRQVLRHSAVITSQFGTPLRNQRSQSFVGGSQSLKKQQHNITVENQMLRDRIQQLKTQIYDIEKSRENGPIDAQEQYLMALKVFQELKMESEQLKLEISYIKQENHLLTKKLKSQNTY